MKYIKSLENSTIRKALSLKQRKFREKEGLYLVEGLNLIGEAIRIPQNIETIFIRQSQYVNCGNGEHGQFLNRLEKAGINAVLVEDKLFGKLTDTKTPQNVVGVIKILEHDIENFFGKTADIGDGIVLVLDRIQDPGNCGTLIRTAEAAGARGIVIVKGTVDPYSPKVVRSATGSILRLPLFFTGEPGETAEILKRHRMKILAASPQGRDIYLDLTLKTDLAIIIGNEGSGVHQDFINEADYLVKIPMSEPVESLNAAVAGGILMYEMYKRNFCRKTEE